MILLGTIEDFFTISGRGTVLMLKFSANADPKLKYRVGDEIELRGTNGLAIDTRIRGLEWFKPIKPRPLGTNIGILLPKDIDPASLSKEMEIWLVREPGESA